MDLNLDFPLSTRSALPDEVRQHLLDCGYSDFEAHPQFHGHASFLISIHQSFLRTSRYVLSGLEELLEANELDVMDNPAFSVIRGAGDQLIEVAHHHHAIEDTHVFPTFMQIYPRLADGLALLESDHLVLSSALDDLGRALHTRPGASDARGMLAITYDRATALERVLQRHLSDEEEIVIPMLLEGRMHF